MGARWGGRAERRSAAAWADGDSWDGQPQGRRGEGVRGGRWQSQGELAGRGFSVFSYCISTVFEESAGGTKFTITGGTDARIT